MVARGYRVLVLGVGVLLLMVLPGVAGAAHPGATCESRDLPVSVPGVPGAVISGELCVPDGAAPTTVQLLVHGASYNRAYFDWPQEPDRYSYARRALAAGYATFSVDRLGAGRSTRPLSVQVTLRSGAEAMHDVVSHLRAGVGGRSFSRVIWVGHSLGSVYAWVEASMYRDVDAFVLTGLLHSLKPSAGLTLAASSAPAFLDPKFAGAGLDPGYLTTLPGKRGVFYYQPRTDPAVIAVDEQLKDTVTATELGEGVLHARSPLPQTAPSRHIRVPTLVVVGDHDSLFCGPPDGFDCTPATVASHEGPYYSGEADLEVAVIPDAGHDAQLDLSAPESTQRMLEWLEADSSLAVTP